MTEQGEDKGQGTAIVKPVMPWPTENPRAREEYYFRPVLLPDHEIHWCCEYELGRIRQTQIWRENIQAFRNISGGDRYEVLRKEADRYRLELKPEQWPVIFYELWPEWPNKPYLSVSAEERKKRIAEWERDFEPEVLEQVNLGELISDYVYESKRLDSLKTDLPLPKLFHHKPPELGETISDSYGETVAFKIYPHLTLSSFKKQAEIWFRQYHQNRGTSLPEQRGASAAAKKLRADLCAIGFWRLVRSGLSREEAANFQLNETDQPLLANDPAAWSRALKRAEKLLRFPLGKNFDS